MTDGIVVTLPSGDRITSKHIASLDLPHVPVSARVCHIFPNLKNCVLISIGQFCDAGMSATFTTTTLYSPFTRRIELLHRPLVHQLDLLGARSSRAVAALCPVFWAASGQQLLQIYQKGDIATYLHRVCFSPVPSTWTAAIDARFFLPGPDSLPSSFSSIYPNPSPPPKVISKLLSSRRCTLPCFLGSLRPTTSTNLPKRGHHNLPTSRMLQSSVQHLDCSH